TAIGTRGREFAQFVADHVFGNDDRDMLTTVVYCDGQTNHLRQNHRTARPGFNRLAIVLFCCNFDLLQQVKIDKRTFLQRTRHVVSPLITCCDDGQSYCQCACWTESWHPWWGSPTATPDDDHQKYALHHHHGGDQPGSWQHHERSDVRRASEWHRPCPGSAGCVHRWILHPGWHGTRRGPCAFRRNAGERLRRNLHGQPAAQRRRRCEQPEHPCRASVRSREWCYPPEYCAAADSYLP